MRKSGVLVSHTPTAMQYLMELCLRLLGKYHCFLEEKKTFDESYVRIAMTWILKPCEGRLLQRCGLL
jgi:hypothetical protein